MKLSKTLPGKCPLSSQTHHSEPVAQLAETFADTQIDKEGTTLVSQVVDTDENLTEKKRKKKGGSVVDLLDVLFFRKASEAKRNSARGSNWSEARIV